MLRLIVEPGPVRDSILDWSTVVPVLFDRARREAVAGVIDPATEALIHQLSDRPDGCHTLTAAESSSTAAAPVIDLTFSFEGSAVSFFSVVSTIGTPIDVTAQELRVEAFFPSDPASRTTLAAAT